MFATLQSFSAQASLIHSAATVPTQKGEPVALTILMPCRNEARTPAACISKAKAFLDRSGIVAKS